MNYALPEKTSSLIATKHHLERSLLTKMKALQERLDNFTVLDRYGAPVGDVRNLVLHNRQLSLVIVQPDAYRHWRFVLLSCHFVKRISLRDRVVHIRTTQADMSYLPEYGAAPSGNGTTVAQEPSKAIAPLRQLSASLLTEHTQRLEPAKKTATGWLTTQKEPLQPSVIRKESSLLDAPAAPKALASATNTTDPRSPQTHRTHHASTSGSMPMPSRGNSDAPLNGQRPKAQPGSSSHRTIALLKSPSTQAAMVDPSAQPLLVQGEFTSPKHASQLLGAIAKTLSHRCKTIRIEIELDDPALQEVCQEWLNQYMAMSKN